jgi:DNA-binding CsgD family transcriptional regulator
MRPSKTEKFNTTSNKPVMRPWSKPNPGLILLDASLNPVAFNLEAAFILAYPESPNLEGPLKFRIPEQILSDVRRPQSTFPVITQFGAGRRRYVSQVFVLKPYEEGTLQAAFALLLQRNCSTMEAIYEVAAEFRLTEREREALKGISMGLTSKELAKEMDISPNTVKAYLRLIMVKMGVSTRAGILAKILEHNPHVDQQALASAAPARPVAMRSGM